MNNQHSKYPYENAHTGDFTLTKRNAIVGIFLAGSVLAGMFAHEKVKDFALIAATVPLCNVVDCGPSAADQIDPLGIITNKSN